MKLNIVPARTGWHWVKLGMRTFWRQPLALSGLFFMFMASMSLASLLPYLGSALALTVLPAATLGLMAATEQAEQGRFPMPSVLISGFRAGRQRARAMLTLGVLYAIGFLAVIGLSALVDGGSFARMYLAGEALTRDTLESGSFQSAVWLAMGLYLPLSLLFWHAPALVHWHGVSPVKSLFFSIVACGRNFGAMTVFGLAWMVLFLAVGVAMMMLVGLLGQPDLLGVVMLPTAMLMAAMFFTSIWFTFRDSFVDDSAA